MNRVEPQGILVMGIFSINHEGVLLIPRPGSGGGDDEGEGWLLWSPEYYTYDPHYSYIYIHCIELIEGTKSNSLSFFGP